MSFLATRLAALCVRGMRGVAVLSLAPAFGGTMLTVGLLTAGLGAGQAEAKTPGKTYCYNRVCHRVKTLAETQAMVGRVETLHTSHYDDCRKDRFNPCGLTSSGEVFRANTPDNAASPIYPNGTVLLIWSPVTKKSAVVRVNNAGPYWRNRKLDVSRATAQKLGFASRGVAQLKVRVLAAPTRAEATYKRKRRYDPVPGYIGEFASLDDAHVGAAQTYAVAALTAPEGAGVTTVAALAPAEAGTETLNVAPEAPEEVAVAAVDAGGADVVAVTAKPASAEVAAVNDTSEAKPITVAALIETTEVSDTEPQSQPNSARNMTGETVRTRSRVERNQPRNSRAYRAQQRQQAASRQKRQGAPRNRTAAVAETPRTPRLVEGTRPITSDPTNDISVFSRHTHTGASRLAAGEMARRNAY